MMHVMILRSCKREICFVGPVNVYWQWFGASIFATSTDKGVVPAWRANGSMLLLPSVPQILHHHCGGQLCICLSQSME